MCLRVRRLYAKMPIPGAYKSTRSWRTANLRTVRRLPFGPFCVSGSDVARALRLARVVHRCDQYCPSNILTTLVDLRVAIWDDILTVVRLVTMCFGNLGILGCSCQFVMTLQPAWRKVSKDKTVRCEVGDPFDLIMTKVVHLILKWISDSVNTHLIDPANAHIIDNINRFLLEIRRVFDTIEAGVNTIIQPFKDAWSGIKDFFTGGDSRAKKVAKEMQELEKQIKDLPQGQKVQARVALANKNGLLSSMSRVVVGRRLTAMPESQWSSLHPVMRAMLNESSPGRRLLEDPNPDHWLKLLPSINRLCVNYPNTKKQGIGHGNCRSDGDPPLGGDPPEVKRQIIENCKLKDVMGGMDMLCYFKRVGEICNKEKWLTEYTDLFAQPAENMTEYNREFAQAFGDSFAYKDPTTLAYLQQAQDAIQSRPDFTRRKDICSDKAFRDSMSLDQIITSCFFHMVEDKCKELNPNDVDFAFSLETASFRLPKIRFDTCRMPHV